MKPGGQSLGLRLQLVTGVLMLLAGCLWLVHALVRQYVFGFVGAAIFLLAGIAFIAGWIRWRGKASS